MKNFADSMINLAIALFGIAASIVCGYVIIWLWTSPAVFKLVHG